MLNTGDEVATRVANTLRVSGKFRQISPVRSLVLDAELNVAVLDSTTAVDKVPLLLPLPLLVLGKLVNVGGNRPDGVGLLVLCWLAIGVLRQRLRATHGKAVKVDAVTRHVDAVDRVHLVSARSSLGLVHELVLGLADRDADLVSGNDVPSAMRFLGWTKCFDGWGERLG